MAKEPWELRADNVRKQRAFIERRGAAWARVRKDQLEEIERLTKEISDESGYLLMWGEGAPVDPPADALIKVLARYRDLLQDYRRAVDKENEGADMVE